MKYFKAEYPIALAFIILGLGVALEHAAVMQGGAPVVMWLI